LGLISAVDSPAVFFRRKKPPPTPAESVPAPAGGAAGGANSTQFLTGDGRVDRRTIEVLLAAIARVSQSQDLEHLLAYIVDTSIEVTGAERGILLERAEQRTKFFDTYRSYVINYNLGEDLVRRFIESRGGTEARPVVRWEEFARLLGSPRLPSGLK
jgi:hypothetical protein